jgi:hypothetical protein
MDAADMAGLVVVLPMELPTRPHRRRPMATLRVHLLPLPFTGSS